MSGLGLVLAGGGGKGAYEIGVWEYLRECGLDKKITAVAGTSVGALNAALFASNSYDNAMNVWKNIRAEQLLQPNITIKTEEIKLFNEKILISSYALDDFPLATFKQDELEKLVKNNVDFNKLKSRNVECYVACIRILKGRIKYEATSFNVNGYNKYDVAKILLASSAIPFVFDAVEFRSNKYIDGGSPIPGIGNNVPVNLLVDKGYKDIIVVHLNKDEKTDKKNFEGVNIIDVSPSVNMGNLFDGTLNFDAKRSIENLNIGYIDARRILKESLNILCKYIDNNINKKKVGKTMKIVKTERELKAAIKDKSEVFVVEGELVKNLKKAQIVTTLSAATLGVLVASLAIATVSAPITGGTSYLVASGILAPVAASTGLEISALVAIAVIGIPVIIALFNGYDVEYDVNGMKAKFTKKNIDKDKSLN